METRNVILAITISHLILVGLVALSYFLFKSYILPSYNTETIATTPEPTIEAVEVMENRVEATISGQPDILFEATSSTKGEDQEIVKE